MVNKNILKVRKQLDKLDNKLLDIIKKRSKLVDTVIKNKYRS
jgi:chorismate mutase